MGVCSHCAVTRPKQARGSFSVVWGAAMTAIDRTAYPRFKRTFSARELGEIYTPTPEERWFAQTAARTDRLRFNLLLLLKCFQRLGYFPALEAIPAVLIAHIRACLGLTPRGSAAR